MRFGVGRGHFRGARSGEPLVCRFPRRGSSLYTEIILSVDSVGQGVNTARLNLQGVTGLAAAKGKGSQLTSLLVIGTRCGDQITWIECVGRIRYSQG